MVDEKCHVLVIEDDPGIRLAMDGLLNMNWLELSFAENGIQGLEMAKSLKPDAIFLDIMMPGMDGFAVCRALRADPDLLETQIIMLTALDDRDSRLTGLGSGADDFMVKPFDGMEVQIRLKTIRQINRFRRLQAERTRFSWMVEHAEEGYLLLNKDGVIQYANPKARQLLHLPEEHLGINFIRYIERYYLPRPEDRWAHWLDQPQNMYLVQPETPTSRPFWLVIEAMDANLGPASQRVVRMRDVTDRMTDYQDVRKFHTMVTHKLRTPVSLIHSSLSLLDREVTFSAEEIRDIARTAWRASQRLFQTVMEVIDYINAPLTLQTGVPVSMDEFERILRKTSEALSLNNVHMKLTPRLRMLSLPLPTHAVELILEELLENSKKFHPQHKPEIQIKVEKPNEKNIRITIQDDGLHLTAEQLSWAWLPYFQSEKNFTGEVAGMGLGFPTICALIWQVGGSVTLSNRQDKPGLLVELTVPDLLKKDV